MLKPSAGEVRKPTKTISGITPVAVMLPPRKCLHGTCIYCPSLNVPQSYTPKSPVVMRALQVNYNAYEQVMGRIRAFQAMHHPTDKIELIIMGGTFLEYPKEFQYKFIKDCYDALNNSNSRDLTEAKKKNEKAKHRCVALCIETRPDVCIKYIDRLLEFGCTRVELGVQMPNDKIYKKVKRGHKVKNVIEATRILKDAGFKIGYHIMPGLFGSTEKKDLQIFKKLFSDENFKPDQLKIYPCQVIKGAELEKEYWKGRYKPYTKKELEELLTDMLKEVPRYCRVMRIMREIPPEYLVAGTTRIDLRKDIEKELRKNNSKLKEIRYREVGFAIMRELNYPAHNLSSLRSDIDVKLIKNSEDLLINSSQGLRASANERDKLKLKTTKYKASRGDEYFLEIVNKNDILFGLLRLRIFNSEKDSSLRSNINNKLIVNDIIHYTTSHKKSRASDSGRAIKQAIIRELHVYGQSLKLGETGEFGQQHQGLGKWLMEEAEKIAKKQKTKKIYVISGVGVREYYKKLGYELKGSYMVKEL